MHRIVVNKALDVLRARQRRPEDAIEDLLPRFRPDGHHQEQFATWPGDGVGDRSRAPVRDGPRRDCEPARIVPAWYCCLRDIEELSTGRNRRGAGISPNAVKLRLHRARLALRTLLADRLQGAHS
jgi:RNA polymerase sigma-70 factor (ECF subfamily)